LRHEQNGDPFRVRIRGLVWAFDARRKDPARLGSTMPVLVVEDSRTMARLARNLLMLIGFNQVNNVFDGVTALARLREQQYGLVICDWNMQPMTGLEDKIAAVLAQVSERV
jgi:PleD family two-component response regulator